MAAISTTFEEGFRHHQAGRLQQAEQHYRDFLQLEPTHAHAWHLLGVVEHQTGRHAQAVGHIQHAIGLDRGEAIFFCNLSIALSALGRNQEALAACQTAIARQPNLPEAHTGLGFVLTRLEKHDEAAEAFYRTLQLQPGNPEAARNLGGALMKIPARLNEAVYVLQKTLELKPDYAEACNDLGCALKYAGQLDEAAAAFRRVLELQPQHAGAYNNLSTTLRTLGRLDEAVAACEQAVALQPNLAEAYSNLGIVLTDIGRLDEAATAFQRALEIKPDYAAVHSRMLFGMQYQPGITPAQLATAHVTYDEQHATRFRSAWQPHDISFEPDRPLRIGFISDGFGQHPVGYFLAHVLERIDKTQFATVCYSDRTRKDAMTNRFQAAATAWHEVFQVGNEELAARIRRDRIDILFDIDGHAGRERLLVFARKPAPVQISWMGYVGTTGLAAMDYLLADRWHIPPGNDSHYRETVLRLPDGYVCYEPPSHAPQVSLLPAQQNGDVTFGSFNQPSKINRQVLKLWARVLQLVPNSRLLLKYRGFDDTSISSRILEALVEEGIAAHRIKLQGKSPHPQLLAEYGRVDIGLDTFPYSGGLTTCEALWMGVPVVTRPGETFAGRHSFSHLSNLGMTETVASSDEHYVELAVELANDLPRLAKLRATLRQKMTASPLCNGERFARNWTEQLRTIWRQACTRA